MNDALLMEIVNGTAELRNDIRDELITLFVFPAFEESEEVLFTSILLNEIDVLLVLEYPIQTSNVGMLAVHLNLQLRGQLSASFIFGYFLFFHDFQSI
jgi:hypothetical protein